MGKKQTNIEKKNYYIPLEITPETIITEEYRNSEVHWSKIGCRKVRTILIPATKEQYYEFMRPLWREDKRQQRHGADEVSADKVRDDYELEVPDDFNLEEEVVKEELLAALRHELAALQDIDRTILMMLADGSSEAAAGSRPMLFGDFSYYWIADREYRSFKRLNELYAANGQIGFLASQRVDGMLMLKEAVQALEMKAKG